MADADRTSYTYGDSALAGDRLALLASIFEPTTAAFLRAAAMAPDRWPEIDPVTGRATKDARRPGIDVAIDLGCGPGFTSRLIGEVVAPDRVVGFDFSAAFVARAKAETAELVAQQVGIGRAPIMYAFVKHDVTRTPFPVPPAPLVFARYLSAHLTDPGAAIAAWCTVVAQDPPGRLLLEEIVSIESDLPVLSSYIETVTAMSAHHGADLLIGRRLPELVPTGCEIVHDELVTIAPDPRLVARMFGMNLTAWRQDAFAVEHLTPAFIDDLEGSLRALAAAPTIPDAGTVLGPLAAGPAAPAPSPAEPTDPLLAAAAAIRAADAADADREAAGGEPATPAGGAISLPPVPPPPAGPGTITWTHRQLALEPRAR
jgi:trans-aconitate 2-methyltransferase